MPPFTLPVAIICRRGCLHFKRYAQGSRSGCPHGRSFKDFIHQECIRENLRDSNGRVSLIKDWGIDDRTRWYSSDAIQPTGIRDRPEQSTTPNISKSVKWSCCCLLKRIVLSKRARVVGPCALVHSSLKHISDIDCGLMASVLATILNWVPDPIENNQ